MFRRLHEMRERGESGFTLIELLVVILIIAILAAIAIPVFLNQRKKGYNAQVQSALKNSATAIESYATDKNGDYSGLNGSDLTTLQPGGANDQGLKVAPGVTGTIKASSSTYCVYATTSNLATGDDWFKATYQSSNGAPAATPDACP